MQCHAYRRPRSTVPALLRRPISRFTPGLWLTPRWATRIPTVSSPFRAPGRQASDSSHRPATSPLPISILLGNFTQMSTCVRQFLGSPVRTRTRQSPNKCFGWVCIKSRRSPRNTTYFRKACNFLAFLIHRQLDYIFDCVHLPTRARLHYHWIKSGPRDVIHKVRKESERAIVIRFFYALCEALNGTKI